MFFSLKLKYKKLSSKLSKIELAQAPGGKYLRFDMSPWLILQTLPRQKKTLESES